ncbi:MAG TPA: hypothetical protein VHY91_03845 [Pirellulales bacterium]|nr:hypothetical protein [Pirellulales bacterium]
MQSKAGLIAVLLAVVVCSVPAETLATETENLGLAVLPAPGAVAIDGRYDDWDLSGGIFVSADVETQRDTLSLWYHAMYDADNLYLLARWNDDAPLNNPGVTSGDLGFRGDCLQTRVIVAFGEPEEKVSHFTCWRGKDGLDVIKVELGRQLHDGAITDLKTMGAKQAFTVADDGKHYAQEIAIPWTQLARDGKSPGPGGSVRLAIEANFGVGSEGRLTCKDCFQPGLTLDRVFTFRAVTQWGTAKLERQGHVSPRPVRLSDGREFAVSIEKGVPVVDWTGLVKKSEAVGIKTVAFDMPEDGFASITLRAADGTVARHLTNCQKLSKGHHELKWDGLSTPNWKLPGEPVPAGTYQVTAMTHQGIGLRLIGWAANSGVTPWDYPAHVGNWGGDHGNPTAVATDGDKVYLGWTGAEAGKALVACDLNGRPVWNHTRGGIGSASALAVDAGTVYVLDRITGAVLFRLDSSKGTYTSWKGRDTTELPVKELFENFTESKEDRFSMAGQHGRLYLASKLAGQIVVFNGATGAVEKRLIVPEPQAICLSPSGRLYVVSGGTKVLAFDKDLGQPKTVLDGLTAAASIAVDAAGKMYVGCGEPDNQIKVFDPKGKLVKTIGRPGGRALVGPWTPDGMRFVDGIALDAAGKLWVMENDKSPKRVSVWNVDTGALVREMFGATNYGANGGAICPTDPLVVIGHECEWRIDPKTGHAKCTAVILREGTENCRFATSADGRTYLFVYSTAAASASPLRVFERLGDARYKLRTVIYYADAEGHELPPSVRGKPAGAKRTMVWSDANDDGQRQPDELSGIDGEMRFNGWNLWVTPDLTLYSRTGEFRVRGYTPCGAPRYELAQPTEMPIAGLGSADGRLVLSWNKEGIERGWMRAMDIASGKQLWQYPDTYVGVHGSHNAPPPIDGLIRGAFPPCGAAKLPAPIGNIWVIPTNVGEWHILTERGYYLTRLFQPDPLHVVWPEAAVPGANLDNVPPGSGGEDFGGTVTLARDGKLYVQTGKTAFWVVEVVGLDAVKEVTQGTATIEPADVPLAQKLREDLLQATAAVQPIWVKKRSPKFTGNIDRDFAGATILKFQKREDAPIRATAVWDEQSLYLAWEVRDETPWVNGTTDRDLMYIGGDTVDFQLATDPAADARRNEGARGDLRVSIGPFEKKPQAVIYRHVADEQHPRTFSSGVLKDYVMQSVIPVEGAEILVKTPAKDRYVVEARLPLTALGLTPRVGLELHGDFGVTYGDPAGQRTRLRAYWSNQHTGIVDDAVFELKMEPQLWGTLLFAE